MKESFLAALLVAGFQLASAHCTCLPLAHGERISNLLHIDTFPDLIVNGSATADWLYVRETANHYSQGPVRLMNIGMRFGWLTPL